MNFKIKDWVMGCVAGAIFTLSYNHWFLHLSWTDSIFTSGLIMVEANLVFLIMIKLTEFLGA